MAADRLIDVVENALRGMPPCGTILSPVEFVSESPPTDEELDAQEHLTFQVRSPVTIEAFDSQGRRVGLADVPTPGVPFFVHEIPNSSIERVSGHITLTLDTGDEYRVVVKGTDSGLFDLLIRQETGTGRPVAIREYLAVPIAVGAVATLTVQNLTSASDLEIDVNGDGVVDFVVDDAATGGVGKSIHITASFVRSLMLEKGIENSILAKLHAAAVAFDRGQTATSANNLYALINFLRAQMGKKIPRPIASGLIKVISAQAVRLL
jgi:hypothetical protein